MTSKTIPDLLDMSDDEYDRHFQRIRQMLVNSGDYEGWDDSDYAERVLDTDAGLILSVPYLNPEFF